MEKETAVRFQDNSPGRYYVTSRCNGCGKCELFGNRNFANSADQAYYYVMQQPTNAFEDIEMRKAMIACPRGCIRDDGRWWN